MSIYVVGDIQGCFQAFQQGLKNLKFNLDRDEIWTVGDLVNRGPQSLEVLEFFYQHRHQTRIVLGNHDLHLIARFYQQVPPHRSDTIDTLLQPQYEYLIDWLRQQPFLYQDASRGYVMVHAGIAPFWSLDQAKNYANELHQALMSPHYFKILAHLYGNQPTQWSPQLEGYDRLRFFTNAFTRMRYCTPHQQLNFNCKVHPDEAPSNLYPWFSTPQRIAIPAKIIFGHWASLKGETHHPDIIGLDTGQVWGGHLTFFKMESM